MSALSETNVYRGGVSAADLRLETSDCEFRFNIDDECVDLRFALASKGGGTTVVLVQIGIHDLSQIVLETARMSPDSAAFLAKGAAIANRAKLYRRKVEQRMRGR